MDFPAVRKAMDTSAGDVDRGGDGSPLGLEKSIRAMWNSCARSTLSNERPACDQGSRPERPASGAGGRRRRPC